MNKNYREKAVIAARRMVEHMPPWMRKEMIDKPNDNPFNVVQCSEIIALAMFGETDNGSASPTGYHFDRLGFVPTELAQEVLKSIFDQIREGLKAL